MRRAERQKRRQKSKSKSEQKRQEQRSGGSAVSSSMDSVASSRSLWRQLFSCADPLTEDDSRSNRRRGGKAKPTAKARKVARRRAESDEETAGTTDDDDDNDADTVGEPGGDEDTATVKEATPTGVRKKRRNLQEAKKPSPTDVDDNVSQSKDSFWQKLFRGADAGTHDGGSSVTRSQQQQQHRAKSPYVGGRRRHKKRLVVAMLEDDDGATSALLEQTQSSTAGASTASAPGPPPLDAALLKSADPAVGGLQIRTTRDETNIRRILQSLSDSLKPQPPLSTERAGVELTTANLPAVQGPPQSTLQASQSSQQHQQQAAPQAGCGDAPASCAPSSTNLPTSASQLKQEHCATDGTRNTTAGALADPPAESQAQSTNRPQLNYRRHGYRIFRRVCSAAESYYGVPFPPLETLKLKEDDDGQWEDQEVYVASHKGLQALNPKANSAQTRLEKPRLQLKGAAKHGSASCDRQQQQQVQQQVQQQQQQQQPQQQHQTQKPPNKTQGSTKVKQEPSVDGARQRPPSQLATSRADKQKQHQQQNQQQQQQSKRFQRMPTKLPVMQPMKSRLG